MKYCPRCVRNQGGIVTSRLPDTHMQYLCAYACMHDLKESSRAITTFPSLYNEDWVVVIE